MKRKTMIMMNPKNIIKKIEKRIYKYKNKELRLALKNKTAAELTDMYFKVIEANQLIRSKKQKDIKKSSPQKKEPTLYMIRCASVSEDFIKIGITRRTVKERFKNSMPYSYKVIKTMKVRDDVLEDYENAIHSYLMKYKYTPILHFGGYTECFTPEAIDKAIKLF